MLSGSRKEAVEPLGNAVLVIGGADMAGGCFYLRDGVFHGDAPAAPPDHFQVDEVVSKGGYIRKGDAAEGCDVPDGGELFRVPGDEAAELGAGEADQGAVGVAAGDRLRLLGAVQLRRDLEGGPAESGSLLV